MSDYTKPPYPEGYLGTIPFNHNVLSVEDIIEAKYNKPVRDVIDELFIRSGYGRLSAVRDKTYSGFNHQQIPALVPESREHMGYTFFVRPTLNLSRENCLLVRQLAKLVTNNPTSIERWVRMTLDYKLEIRERLDCPLMDNRNVFITKLTNLIRTFTNVPSVAIQSRTTDRGYAKEVWSMPDDYYNNYDSYTVTASFRNEAGNPIFALISAWMVAYVNQYLGNIAPTWEDRMYRKANYTTRIYRITLDHTKTFITNIWAPIFAYPTTIELGSLFGFDIENPINQNTQNVDVQFQCVGSIYNDDLLMWQFNQSVAMLNPAMYTKTGMVKIPAQELLLYNYYGYPYIDLNTTKLEWWVNEERYQEAREYVKKNERFYPVSPDLYQRQLNAERQDPRNGQAYLHPGDNYIQNIDRRWKNK